MFVSPACKLIKEAFRFCNFGLTTNLLDVDRYNLAVSIRVLSNVLLFCNCATFFLMIFFAVCLTRYLAADKIVELFVELYVVI